MDIIEESDFTIKKTCEILKLNPDRYYRWRCRFNNNGFAGLKNHKSNPGSSPHSLLEEEKQKIIEHALENLDVRHRKLAYEMQNEDYVSNLMGEAQLPLTINLQQLFVSLI